MIFKTFDLLNIGQKVSLALLVLISLFLFFIFAAVVERASNRVSELPEVVYADNVLKHINSNSELYDLLKNTNPQYTPKNIFEGAAAENFTEYFGSRQSGR